LSFGASRRLLVAAESMESNSTASSRSPAVMSMSESEAQILQALNELDAAVKALPTANPKPDLLALFARIDALAQTLPRSADPELLHFLQRKSYEKARARLEGRAAARGACGSPRSGTA
jgi:hypothetical protein